MYICIYILLMIGAAIDGDTDEHFVKLPASPRSAIDLRLPLLCRRCRWFFLLSLSLSLSHTHTHTHTHNHTHTHTHTEARAHTHTRAFLFAATHTKCTCKHGRYYSTCLLVTSILAYLRVLHHMANTRTQK